ncbi:hypothetical protein M3Y98_00675700 [Aphelenchoides besseyi]|nr:hypothetical protein M3Y98_00675700 [Aphelenchoides besseyi]
MEPKKPQLNDAVGALLIRIFRTFLISRRFPSILLRSVDDKAYKPKHYKDPCLKFIIKSVAFYSSRYFGHDIHLQEIPISMARILVALSDVQRLQLEFLTTRTSRQVVGEWQRLCLALKDHRTLKAIEVNVFDSNTLSFQILMDNVSEKIVCVYAYKKPIAYHLEQSSKQLEKFVFNNRNWRTVQTPDLVCLLAVHARKLVLEDLNFLIFTLPDVRPLKRNEFVRVLKIKNDMVENFVRFFS